MRPIPIEQVEGALFALVSSLARILIPLEITPDRVAHISRTAFVKAAALHATKRVTGKPHIARIAALTGLSRLEVKRIVQNRYAVEKRKIECSPRATRVLTAWQSHAPYSRRGKPRKLPLRGEKVSFAGLCRDYSGDIPHRVILDELIRTARVKLNKAGSVVVLSSSANSGPLKEKNTQAIRFAAAFVSAALQDEQVLVRRLQRVITATSVPPAYVENAISGKVNDVLDQLPRLFPKTSRSGRGGVRVFALVAKDPVLEGK